MTAPGGAKRSERGDPAGGVGGTPTESAEGETDQTGALLGTSSEENSHSGRNAANRASAAFIRRRSAVTVLGSVVRGRSPRGVRVGTSARR